METPGTYSQIFFLIKKLFLGQIQVHSPIEWKVQSVSI